MEGQSRLRITAIRNQRTGARDPADEYPAIANEGAQAESLAGCVLTVQRAKGPRLSLFTLPGQVHTAGQGVGGWTCPPGALVLIRTGAGRDAFHPPAGGQPARFEFHMGRGAFVWTSSGDWVYLRHPHGHFIAEPFLVP